MNSFSYKNSLHWGLAKPFQLSVGRKIKNDIYYLYSLKVQRIVTLESRLEYYNWLMIESNPDIYWACEQFPRLKGRRGEYYTLDAWVKRSNGEETIMEVKESKNLIEENGLSLPKKLYNYYNTLEEKGVSLKINTEKTLEKHSILINNWLILYPYLVTTSKNPLLIKQILSLCSPLYDISLEEFIYNLQVKYPVQDILSHIFLLNIEGKLKTDIDTFNLSYETKISR